MKEPRRLIVNADGYGMSPGIIRATEECIDFGTVRSLSANVNFAAADGLRALVRRHPGLSVGCHLNPVVGPPLLSRKEIPSLVGKDGEFHHGSFEARLARGEIRLDELRRELSAQIDRTRELAGDAFSHVDFHKGFHRSPRLYGLFLDLARASGVGRIRTHRYRVGMETPRPALAHWVYVLRSPSRAAKYAWNLALRARALRRGLAMPDSWVQITEMGPKPSRIDLPNYLALLANLPPGIHEFVAHPGYVDDELRRYSTYLAPREAELRVLRSREFRDALTREGVRLAGYRDIPLRDSGSAASRPTAAERRPTPDPAARDASETPSSEETRWAN